jgi:hypothetical protein
MRQNQSFVITKKGWQILPPSPSPKGWGKDEIYFIRAYFISKKEFIKYF